MSIFLKKTGKSVKQKDETKQVSNRQDIVENNEEKFNSFLDYLDQEKGNLAIIMAIRDTPGSKMSPNILVKLQKLGFYTFYTELWRMYIGIIDKGQTIVDYRAPEKEDTISYSCELDGHELEIHSSSWRRENYASILIDKIEYAVNMRGINLVAYNYTTGEICSSVSYDSHDDISHYNDDPLIRQKRLSEWLVRKKHYDIMLMGTYYGSNYGSILNGYAEYKTLKKMGKSVLMLSAPGFAWNHPELGENMHNVKFIKKYYDRDDVSPVFKLIELEQLNDYADIFATGSDQLWNWPISFWGSMYQNFVHNDKKKISLATSCGAMNDRVPESKKKYVKDCLKDYDAISVREESSRILLRKKYGIFAHTVLEPVFWLNREEYDTLINDSQIYISNRNYILAYILDPNDQKLVFLNQIAKKMKMNVITIPDGQYEIAKTAWDRNDYIHKYPGCLPHTEVVDLLKLYANSSFVVTDSFHGTCFSIIFQRKFISICNEQRGKDRFYHLLSLFDLKDRLINSSDLSYRKEFNQDIDYQKVENIIETERKKTFQWIEEALDKPKKNKHICKAKRDCIGCGACASVCPTDALKMVMGQYGYYEPKVDVDKCIDCGKCKTVCPAIVKLDTCNTATPELYECILKDKNELKKCSSGGAFPLIAKKILSKNGVVYGVAWGEDYRAEYRRIDTVERLHELQKSKYIQAYVGNAFRKVKEDLEGGNSVLFSGVPCHVAGLYKYLDKEYNNLITVDLLCGYSPSEEFFQQYIKEDCPENLVSYEFRTKDPRWNVDCSTLTLTLNNGERQVRHGVENDIFQRAFHSHIMCPEHCEKCNYSKYPRIADITIGDFWWVDKRDITIDTQDGVSAILLNNNKAKELFNNLQNENVFLKKVPLDWLNGNGHTLNNNWVNKGRNTFYDAILEHSFIESLEIAEKVK